MCVIVEIAFLPMGHDVSMHEPLRRLRRAIRLGHVGGRVDALSAVLVGQWCELNILIRHCHAFADEAGIACLTSVMTGGADIDHAVDTPTALRALGHEAHELP